MSQHLRKDNTCLNCGTLVEERYCSHCGQENLDPTESFSHLFQHFFEDVTHYDSKLFITIKDLLFKPGLLTKEYLAGRRASYLHPIRMYVFVSFLYFLTLLSFNHTEEKVEEGITKQATYQTKKEIADNLHAMRLTHRNDTPLINEIIVANGLDTISTLNHFYIINDKLEEYDSIQIKLPESKRTNKLSSWIYQRSKGKLEHYGEATVPQVIAKTAHNLPKAMFLLLPLFALLLKLFYNRKKYLYADHAIFSLHFHTAFFLLLLVSTIISKIFPSIDSFNEVIMWLVFIYLVFALRNAYHQSLLKSLLKGALLVSAYFICISFIAAGLILIALLF
jgi:hypothetical protein